MLIQVDLIEKGLPPDAGFKACLDSPLYGYQSAGDIKVSGWILPDEVDGDAPLLVIKLDRAGQQSLLNPKCVERPDVIKALVSEFSELAAKLKVGFSAEIFASDASRVSLFVLFRGREIHWCDIVLMRSSDVEFFVDKVRGGGDPRWKKFYPKKILDSVKILEYFREREVDRSIVRGHLRKVISSVRDFSLLRALYDAKDFVAKCQKTGMDFVIHRSILMAPHNFLLCSSDGYMFFIHQHVSSVDGVYYPCEGVYFNFGHNSHGYLHLLLNWIAEWRGDLQGSSATSMAFLVGHGRPYHFMYDTLLGLQVLNSRTPLASSSSNFYTLREDSFIDALKIFGRDRGVDFIAEDDALSMEAGGVVFVKLGALFDSGAKDEKLVRLLGDVDKLVLGYVRRIFHSEIQTSSTLRKHFPVLWVGVTVQKRSWLEQVEGYAAIINKLHESFPSMLVVFDGWTSPYFSAELDDRECAADGAVVQNIKDLIQKDISFVDLVGSTIEEKVYVASFVDMAVVNFATGSINVSRICGRPCVTHMSNSFYPARFQHIHKKNSFHVPSDLVADLVSESLDIDKVSYSIDWRCIYDAIVAHFGRQNVVENRTQVES